VSNTRAGRAYLNYCWVEVDGRVVHVSSYVGLPRPRARCPVCGAVAVLHLGNRRAHHYQHKNGISSCPLSAGETAKHFNAKHHVAEQLRGGASLHVSVRCPGDADDTNCPHTSELLFAQNWNTVDVESTVGSVRPDVLVNANTGLLAAIEILVTHSVSQGKAAVLAELKVPWVEVAADDALGWKAGEPLPVFRTHLTADAWLCFDHRAARDLRLKHEAGLEELRRAVAARAAREQQEAESKLARQRTVRLMAIDAVADAKRVRYIFRVNARMDSHGGEAEKVWLA
jgi:hypothetical protein